MGCSFYYHDGPYGLTKYISGTTCNGLTTYFYVNYEEGVCMDDSQPILNLGSLIITGSCTSDPTPTPTSQTICIFSGRTYETAPFQCPNDGNTYDDIYGRLFIRTAINGVETTDHPDYQWIVSNGSETEIVNMPNGQSFIEFVYPKQNFVYTSTGCTLITYPDWDFQNTNGLYSCFATPTPTPSITPTYTPTVTPTNTVTPTESSGCIEIGSGFAGGGVYDILVDDDDKIVCVGDFVSYSGFVCNGVVKLLPDGTRDTGFAMGFGFRTWNTSTLQWFTGLPQKIVKYSADTYLIAGIFSTYSSSTYWAGSNGVQLLANNGDAIEKSFGSSYTGPLNSGQYNQESIVNGLIYKNDYFYVSSEMDWSNAGNFNICSTGIFRVDNNTYYKDTTWIPYVGSGSLCGFSTAPSIIEDSNGDFICIGFNGLYKNPLGTSYKIAKIDDDGNDISNYGTGFTNNPLYSAQKGDLQSDGKLIVAGTYVSYSGQNITGVCRLNTNGYRDMSFQSPTGTFENGFNGVIGGGTIPTIGDVKVLSNGQILIVGDFVSYSGFTCNGIIKLNSDGTIDTSFNYDGGFNDIARVIKVSSDGLIYIGGDFTTYNYVESNKFVKINQNGYLKDCTITPTPTPSITATNTATPTVTPTNTPTNTATQTNTPTVTPTPSITSSNTPTPTTTLTTTPTPTPTTNWRYYSVRGYSTCGSAGSQYNIRVTGTLSINYYYCISSQSDCSSKTRVKVLSTASANTNTRYRCGSGSPTCSSVVC